MSRNDNIEEECSTRKKRRYNGRSIHSADSVLDSDVSSKTNKITTTVCKNNDDVDIIDSESNQTLLDDILKGIRPLRKLDFPLLLKMFERKEVSAEQFERLLSIKAETSMTDGCDNCKGCKNENMFLENEQSWKSKYETSNKALKEILAVVKLHINQNVDPLLVQSAVGTQTLICTKKEETITTLNHDLAVDNSNNDDSSSELDQKPIDIFSDDDVKPFDTMEIATPSSENYEYLTPKTEVSSSILDHLLPPLVLRKPVPPAIPINSSTTDLSNDETKAQGYFNCTSSTSLDLINRDLIKISSVFTLAKPSKKIVHGQESSSIQLMHPAPLPEIPLQNSFSSCEGVSLPPAPNLKIMISTQGQNQGALLLSWDMPATKIPVYNIMGYQVFVYHEVVTSTPKTETWKNIGSVKALPLPMKCSLNQFKPGEKYHFAVRAINSYNQIGPFSKVLTHTS